VCAPPRSATRWFDSEVRSTFGYADSDLLSALESQRSDVDGDDDIKVWAAALGTDIYDTSLGGSNNVPSSRIEQVELVRRD